MLSQAVQASFASLLFLASRVAQGETQCRYTCVSHMWSALCNITCNNSKLALVKHSFRVASVLSLWPRIRNRVVLMRFHHAIPESVVITVLAFCRYALPEADVLCQVQHALSLVGMEKFQNRTTHTLSGGQKQRVAIAGALAECPKVCSCRTSVSHSAGRAADEESVAVPIDLLLAIPSC